MNKRGLTKKDFLNKNIIPALSLQPSPKTIHEPFCHLKAQDEMLKPEYSSISEEQACHCELPEHLLHSSHLKQQAPL